MSKAFVRMAKSRLRNRVFSQVAADQPHASAGGFTLLEVLISELIVGLIMSGLTFLVVELLRIDRRELALEQVQRDMQRAISYVSEDLEEAVYVYSNPAVVAAQLDDLNTELTANAGSVPVLAFWRTDAIDVPSGFPSSCASEGANSTTCELIRTRRSAYTLVVYYQRPQYGEWEGDTVLKRYELSKYDDLSNGSDRYKLTPGYRDPVTGGGTDFENWTPDGTVTAAPTQVLVAYVADAVPAAGGGTAIACPNLVASSSGALTGVTDATNELYDYVLAPVGAGSTTGFFACIRNQPSTAAFRANQDVYLFLRGDISASRQFLQPASANSRLPVLQTQVRLFCVVVRDGDFRSFM